MSSALDLLHTYVAYADWADDTMLAACSSLAVRDLERDLGASHGSLLGTLRHVYLSNLAWRDRIVTGELPALVAMAAPEQYSGSSLPLSLPELRERWPGISRGLLAWLDTLTDAELDREMTCLFPSGALLRTTRAEILLHDLNHATLHRGQVISMLRLFGVQPPNLDIFSFYLHRS